jgi:Ser/Thr protein kinase RdoA (MazF antagonist)
LTASPLQIVLDHGLVVEQNLLEASFNVREVGGRNKSTLVTTESAAFLVKVLHSAGMAQREAAGLEWCAAVRDRRGFSVSRVRVLDGPLLITETTPALRPISEFLVNQRFPRVLLRRLGANLARLHSLQPRLDAQSAEYLPIDLAGAPLTLLDQSRGVRELMAALYVDEPLMEALHALVEHTVGRTGPAHGDVRSANLLVHDGAASTGMYLIDWETAGVADPMIDVGGAICQVLANSIRAATKGPDRAGLRVLLGAYRASGGNLDLVRAVRRAGVSLIQCASETLASSDGLTPFSRSCLKIARLALLTPESLAIQLRLVT